MSSWWVTTEMDEFGGFQRDWYGPYPSEADAEKVAVTLSKQGQELVVETIFGAVGRDGIRFSEFLRGQRFASGASGWFSVKPSPNIQVPTSANGRYPTK